MILLWIPLWNDPSRYIFCKTYQCNLYWTAADTDYVTPDYHNNKISNPTKQIPCSVWYQGYAKSNKSQSTVSKPCIPTMDTLTDPKSYASISWSNLTDLTGYNIRVSESSIYSMILTACQRAIHLYYDQILASQTISEPCIYTTVKSRAMQPYNGQRGRGKIQHARDEKLLIFCINT